MRCVALLIVLHAYCASCVLSRCRQPVTSMTSGLCYVSTRLSDDNDKKLVSQAVVAGTSSDIDHTVGVTLPDETICNETSCSSSGELNSVDVAAITSAGSMSEPARDGTLLVKRWHVIIIGM